MIPKSLGKIGKAAKGFEIPAERKALEGDDWLPPEIGKAASLMRLRLGSNRIAGSIPASVSGMKSINFLNLGSNRLAGPVPAELGNCS